MDYRAYQVEDFLFDESFRQWTSGTSAQATAFWEQWLVQHPDRVHVVRQAQEMIRVLNNHYRDDATDDRLASELQRLMNNAAERRDSESVTPIVPLLQRTPFWRWVAAAVLVFTIGISGWFYINISHKAAATSYANLTKITPVQLQEKINNGAKAVNLILGDGSVVILQPKSRLSYPRQFAGANRTVYLNGEAFFDVVKNPASPFLIYANQTVTKVLGTSFLVRAFDGEKDVTVAVRTGRVSVYKQQEFERAQQLGIRRIQGIVLTPNQQMIFNLEANRLTKALVEKPAALMPSVGTQEQVFEDAPVAKVLTAFERTYGIKILFNEADLSACLVNLMFTNETLLERLDVVCQTIGASYEVHDGQIVINSKGCK
ncbi:FecR family protein [Spirosoma fluviale]|uniref:FecR family protein n=1 Tax=Spirosoma fluviale TaxID=1597977 RepID=A0A286GJD2_9BACT|nr:FecR family protein [Spirosoma fluviale]SOD95229.1 FecR family protein [Spirosoma fluviale]